MQDVQAAAANPTVREKEFEKIRKVYHYQYESWKYLSIEISFITSCIYGYIGLYM